MITQEIQGALADALADPGTPTVGPFAVLIDPVSAVPGRNYAAPIRPDEPTSQDVAALVALMRKADRMPRLEFVAPHPTLEARLAEAGFDLDHRVALMVLDRLVPTPPPQGYEVTATPSDDDVAGAAAVMTAGYDDPEPPESAVRRLRRFTGRGGTLAVARETATGLVVGAGIVTLPQRGFRELASVAVLAEHRRRGVGAAVAGVLTEAALASGAQAFLQAETGEVSLYARVGYQVVGELVFAELTG